MCTKTKQLRDFDSLYDLLDYFNTEEKCVDYLAKLRWNDEPECPYCGNDSSYVINTTERGKRWKCTKCHKQYSIRVGTIFEESKLPLKKWFVAIYLITAHKKGISSHQLSRDLKITQKSAWFVLQRVREAYKPEHDKFVNKVEVDETYIGGKEKNIEFYYTNKTVYGIVSELGGRNIDASKKHIRIDGINYAINIPKDIDMKLKEFYGTIKLKLKIKQRRSFKNNKVVNAELIDFKLIGKNSISENLKETGYLDFELIKGINTIDDVIDKLYSNEK